MKATWTIDIKVKVNKFYIPSLANVHPSIYLITHICHPGTNSSRRNVSLHNSHQKLSYLSSWGNYRFKHLWVNYSNIKKYLHDNDIAVTSRSLMTFIFFSLFSWFVFDVLAAVPSILILNCKIPLFWTILPAQSKSVV